MTNSSTGNIAAANRPLTPPNCGNIECFQTPVKAVRIPRYIGEIRTPHLSTPRKAKRTLDIAKKIIQRQQKTIKTLKQAQRRLVVRIRTIKGLIQHLKKKRSTVRNVC